MYEHLKVVKYIYNANIYLYIIKYRNSLASKVWGNSFDGYSNNKTSCH